jgi:glycosyltransferase involved in cell wall biosynthesis
LFIDKIDMKILIINWRSLKDPNSGGAEQVTFEHAKRWIKIYQAQVTWISPRFKGCKSFEIIDGVVFQCIGFPLGLTISKLIFTFPVFYFLVFFTYIKDYRNKVDIVIEGVHGIPLLTSIYVVQPLVAYVQEVAGPIWDKMYKFPVNILGKNIEKIFFQTYKNKAFVVGSLSAKNDLLNIGIDSSNISIVNHGVKTEVYNGTSNKESNLTVLFVNRVVKMKGAERAIEMFSLLIRRVPEAKLWVVGRYNEDYKKTLVLLAEKLNIQNSISFFGFVTDEIKIDLMRRAHVLINTSYKEGWGLCNIEANTQGTPVVAFDVEGNKDSVVDGVNGYLVADGDLKSMVNKIVEINENSWIGKSALDYSRQFNWKDKSKEFYNILNTKVSNEK